MSAYMSVIESRRLLEGSGYAYSCCCKLTLDFFKAFSRVRRASSWLEGSESMSDPYSTSDRSGKNQCSRKIFGNIAT